MLKKYMQDITKTWTIVGRPTLDILMMIVDGELMPSLVVRDGVCVLNGDILLKVNPCFRCI